MMVPLRATRDPQALQQFSKLAANLLVVCAVISAVLFSFIFFTKVTTAWNQLSTRKAQASAVVEPVLPKLAQSAQQAVATLTAPKSPAAEPKQIPVEKRAAAEPKKVPVEPKQKPSLLTSLANLVDKIANPKEIKINLPMIANAGGEAAASTDASNSPDPGQSANLATPQPWDGTSRVTVLVMGLDYRDWEAGSVPRSDSMWLFTVDPVSKTAGMMSIPRDTWVYVPGFDYAKINMAYFYGEAYHTEGGGPALAMQTVSQFLDVPVQYYVQVDFNAFVQFIDKLDGIYIDVPEKIVVDPIGQGNTFTLEPGRQRIFGAVALAYARNRYTAGGDFDRAKRQLQVINAVRERVMDPKYLPILVGNAKGVYDLIANGVHTNLKLDEAIRLAWLAQQVKPENIHHATLDRNQMYDSWSPQGWSIEVPIMDQVMAVRDSIFSTEAAPQSQAAEPAPAEIIPATSGALPQEVVNEGASILILNGTNTVGLAARTAEYLKSAGLTNVDFSDAQGFFEQTSVVDYQGKSQTTALLATMLGIPQERILNTSDANVGVDIVVILGEDWASSNPLQ